MDNFSTFDPSVVMIGGSIYEHRLCCKVTLRSLITREFLAVAQWLEWRRAPQDAEAATFWRSLMMLS
ncbi:MAG: hypothetical protein ACJAY6_001636 [Yoonia sp.]|jgi:hypothetical protein